MADWFAEPALGTLTRGGEVQKLEPKVMEVLLHLARQERQVVTQEALEAAVWPGVIVTPQSVYQAMAQLRRALGDDPRHPRYIETVPRRGYRLIAPIEWPDRAPAPEQAEPPARTSAAAPHPAGRLHAARRWAWPALAALLAASLLAWNTWRPAPADGQSIAVLPFRDLSPDASQGYLTVTLTEELTHALGQVAGLQVSARSSAQTVSDEGDDPQRLGEELKVSHVLRGSLRRAGDRVRVVATLIDTRSGYQVWSQTYEQPAANLIGLPAQIAGAVAGELRLVLAGDPGVGGSRLGTRNPTAYDFYMLGQHRYSERTAFALSESERYYQQAIEADPGFAAAYVGIANVRIAEYYFSGRPLTETVELINPQVQRALQLDPQFGPALAIQGWAAMEIGNYAAARRLLERALVLAPNHARAHLWLGMALSADGQFVASLPALEQAVRLDPLNFIVHIRHALVLEALGRMDEASQAARRATTLAPAHPNPQWMLALLASSTGDLTQAVRHYENALTLAPERADLRNQLATLYLDLGNPDAARAHLERAARDAHNSQSYLGARALLAFLDGDATALADIAETLASLDASNAFYLSEAAGYMLLAGRPRETLTLYEHAMQITAPDATQHDLWLMRWGLESPAVYRAIAHSALGEHAAATEVLAQHERYVDALEVQGYRHWGLWYQRAAIAAQRGQAGVAMQHLERAVQSGWRRAWWAAVDPALAPLRERPDFAALLSRTTGLRPPVSGG